MMAKQRRPSTGLKPQVGAVQVVKSALLLRVDYHNDALCTRCSEAAAHHG